MIYRSTRPRRQRRGVILMVVLILLTLFAIVGITFVYYSQSQATGSRYWRESDFDRFRAGQTATPPGGGGGGGGGGSGPVPLPGVSDGPAVTRWGLGQIIYDVADDASGINSAARGHSLARTMWGFNDTTLNQQPFSGTGRWHFSHGAGSVLSGQDDYNFPNYTYFQSDGFIRDPERYGLRGATTTTRQPFTGGLNVSYTYPDIHNMFVAAVKADGTVMVPSFHRPWIFGSLAPGNPNWTNGVGKYLTLRPRPADMGPGFPYPTDATGDVKNKTGAPGGNDSIWMDLDHPVLTNGDGRKYKPLFAWLVEPLDNRIDVNVHGNRMGPNGAHASHQGWGRWEVNPGYVLNADATEWYNLLKGKQESPTVFLPGRYGPDGVPNTTGSVAGKSLTPRVFSQVDFNATNEASSPATASTRYLLPSEGTHPPIAAFPLYNGSYGNASAAEQLQHPLQWDYFRPGGWMVQKTPAVPPSTPATYGPQWDDENLNIDKTYNKNNNYQDFTDLRQLILTGYLNSEVALSRFTRLCPFNLSDAGTTTMPLTPAQLAANARRRNMVTTISMDLNRPAIGPWLYDRTNSANYNIGATGPVPVGAPTAMPSLSSRGTNIPNPTLPNIIPSDFSATEWRSVIATLQRVDLNRSLRPYPHRVSNAGVVEIQHTLRFDTLPPAGMQMFLDAHTERQALARDVYDRLVAVTGAARPADPTKPTDAELLPLRWLAQLAVNIVDFIDEDEISTPFNFYGGRGEGVNIAEAHTNPTTKEELPRYWVFGTELPAVVLNEVMAEYQIPVDAMNNPADGQYQTRVVAELHNALPPAGSTPNSVQQQDGKAVPLYFAASGSAPAYSPYRLVVGNTNTNAGGPLYPRVPANDNVVGATDVARAGSDFGAATTRTVGDATAAVPVAVDPQGYFLVSATPADFNNTLTRAPGTTPLYVDKNLQYPVNFTAATNVHDPDERTNGLTVALRRLANPHLPPDNNAVVNGNPNPLYNPYVTVDFVEKVPLNEYKANNDTYASVGKQQPYAADHGQLSFQKSQTAGKDDAIQHTFGRANLNPDGSGMTPTGKYLWLQHLDRLLISPLELLNVSGCRPHELTHQFVTSAGNYRHRTPWFDEDVSDAKNPTTMPTTGHRLWRFFELVETANMATGLSRLGRDPGKVNINMIWEYEVLMALCDPQGANSFTTNQVHNPSYSPPSGMGTLQQRILQDPNAPLYYKLLASRTPDMLSGGIPGPNDRPFTSLGVGDRPANDAQGQHNINNTLLRAALPGGNGTTARLFELPDLTGGAMPHPDRQFELLNKIFNNVTTRSNVFAVYLTIGFFDVTDDTVRPVKLGKECDTGGTRVRWQFFCIVDRTAMSIDIKSIDPITGGQGYADVRTTTVITPPWTPGPTPTPPPTSPGAVTQKDAPVWVSIPFVLNPTTKQQIPNTALAGVYSYDAVGPDVTTPAQKNIPWQIQKGSLLLVDDGADQETVEVLDVDQAGGRFQAVFKRWHFQGFRIRLHGNPGPQPNFDYYSSKYRPVVLHTYGPFQVP